MIRVTRPVKRISPAVMHSGGKHRNIVIELRPPGDLIGFRLMGMRTIYYLPVAHCYIEALRAEMARQRAERRAQRKLRKGAK